MERQDYINLLESKDETITQFKSMIESLKKVLEANATEKLKLLDQLAKLTAEVSKLNDYNQRYNKFTFGKKSLKSSSKPDNKPGSEEEERNYDGTSGSLPEVTSKAEASSVTVDGVEPSKVSSEPLEKKRGPRGLYTTMDAAKVEILESRIDLLPEGIRYEMYITKDSTDKINVIDGTHCTPEFMSSLTIDRFQLHLPVYRELIRLTGEKMFISEQTVSNWLRKGYELLQNLLPCLKTMLLQSKSVLHIDETWCRVRIVKKEFLNGRYLKKYIWVLVNNLEKIVYFLYDSDEDDSRGTRPISTFLEGFTGGIQTDTYVAYRFFVKLNPENEHILCWAHIRAKFKYASDISHDKDAGWFVHQNGRYDPLRLVVRILYSSVARKVWRLPRQIIL